MNDACPHGFLDISNCPECSKHMNVKPLNVVRRKSFVEMPLVVENLSGKKEKEEVATDESMESPVDTLKVTRLLENKSLDIHVPENSTHLHARLDQILATKPGEIDTEFNDTVERRVREIRKSEFNPRVK